jgi:CspA family cold shock protein
MSEETSTGAETLKGVVKWFNDAKGFGFIEHTSGKDVFVHYSVIDSSGFKTLKDGEEVLYELKEGAKGLHASAVRRVNAPVEEAIEKAPAEESTARPERAGRLAAEIVQEVVPSQQEEVQATTEQAKPKPAEAIQ